MTEGAHDMGGARGFGRVRPEPNEPPFHAEWERRAFALTLAMAMPGGWNIDMSRAARENRPPQDYLSKSYYEIWLAGLEQLMAERGLVARDEIEAGRVLHPPLPGKARLSPEDVAQVLYRGAPTGREPQLPARFKVGDRVRARNDQSADAHAPAALCARPRRRGRAGAWLSCLPRQQCSRRGRRPAMAVHGVLRRRRTMGRRRRY